MDSVGDTMTNAKMMYIDLATRDQFDDERKRFVMIHFKASSLSELLTKVGKGYGPVVQHRSGYYSVGIVRFCDYNNYGIPKDYFRQLFVYYYPDGRCKAQLYIDNNGGCSIL